MNDNEIAKLINIFESNKGNLYWFPESRTCQKVIGIGFLNKDEPSEQAYFYNGEYAALYNADLSDFAIIERL